MDRDETWLANSLLALADSLRTHESAYLDTLTRKLVELVAPAQVGVLVASETGGLGISAASSRLMQDLLELEMRYGEGPCTTCHATGQRLPRQSLGWVDDRWPRFGPATRRAGFAWVAALPIRRGTERLGAVTILAGDRDELPESRLDIAATLIEAAAIGLVQRNILRQSLRRAEQLQRALDSRVLIEQAKGVLAARLNTTPEGGFELLRQYARRHGRRLRDVAGKVIAGTADLDEIADPSRDSGAAVRSRRP